MFNFSSCSFHLPIFLYFQTEYRYRRDFREELVFTIDPVTARDLDDALHIKEIEDGLVEVCFVQ